MESSIFITDENSKQAAISIFDAIIMAIIEAYPNDAKDRKKHVRLNQIKSAMFGIKSPRGRSKHDDLNLLILMSEAYLKQGGEIRYNKNYDIELSNEETQQSTILARQAIERYREINPHFKPHSENSIPNLQKKFDKHKLEWLKIAHHQKDMRQTVFSLKINELSEVLTPLGVRLKMPES